MHHTQDMKTEKPVLGCPTGANLTGTEKMVLEHSMQNKPQLSTCICLLHSALARLGNDIAEKVFLLKHLLVYDLPPV